VYSPRQAFCRPSLAADRQGPFAERLQRVRDYIEAHLDDDLSLTVG
jgi:hypothetical protein